MFGKDDLAGNRERVPSHEEITQTLLQFGNSFQYTLCILFYHAAEAQRGKVEADTLLHGKNLIS